MQRAGRSELTAADIQHELQQALMKHIGVGSEPRELQQNELIHKYVSQAKCESRVSIQRFFHVNAVISTVLLLWWPDLLLYDAQHDSTCSSGWTNAPHNC